MNNIRFLRRLLPALAIGVLLSAPVRGSGGESNLGKEFWFTLPFTNFFEPPVEVYLLISSASATTGLVEIPGMSFTAPFSVSPAASTKVVLPVSWNVPDDTVANYGIHVVAGGSISVVVMVYKYYDSDGFLAVPVEALGLQYIVQAYGNEFTPKSMFAVVATEDGTSVTINPSAGFLGHPRGVPYTKTLNRGQTYCVSRADADDGHDYSGTVIVSNKPVGVIGGNTLAYVPSSYPAGNRLMEMMAPVDAWGTEFLAMPFAYRLNGYTVLVTASENGTEVRINGWLTGTLAAGQKLEVVCDGPAWITTTKPAGCAQYAHGAVYDGTESDPTMMLVPPVNGYLSDCLTTSASVTRFPVNYLNIIAPTDSVASLRLDGSPLAFPSVPIDASGYSGFQVPVDEGRHQLTGDKPFMMWCYGFGYFDAYGYTAGRSLPRYRLNIAKSVEPKGEVVAGSLVTYTVSWSNYGFVSAANVVITDSIPAGIHYAAPSLKKGLVPDALGMPLLTASEWASAPEGPWTAGEPPNGTASPLVLRWVLNRVMPSASGWLSFQVRPTGAGGMARLVNRASATLQNETAEIYSEEVSSEITTPLKAALAVPATVRLGDWFTLTVTLTNTGSNYVGNITPQIETAPAASLVVMTGGPVPANFGLNPGESATFTWTFSPGGTGTAGFTFIGSGYDSVVSSTVFSYTSGQTRVLRRAHLSVSMLAEPGDACVGQEFIARAVIKNTGEVDAAGVYPGVPQFSGAGTASMVAGHWPPGPLAVPAGGTVVFTWTMSASSLGGVTVSATLFGTESGSTLDLATGAVDLPGFRIGNMPVLDVGISVPPRLSRGQSFLLAVTATNTGGSSVTSASPSLAVGPGGVAVRTGPFPPNPVVISGGACASFSWTCSATGNGLAVFTATVSGLGCVTNPLSASGTASATVEEPAALKASLASWPVSVNEGSAFLLVMTVSNTGGASAVQVRPSNPQISGTGQAVAGAGPYPSSTLTVAGGEFVVFTWTMTAVRYGTVAFGGYLYGFDSNSLAPLPNGMEWSNQVEIRRPADFAVAVNGFPSPWCLGQPLLVTVTVTNTGQNAANSFDVETPLVSGTGGALLVDGPSPPVPPALAAGSALTFTWTFTAGPAGAIVFSTTISGLDALDSAVVSRGPVVSATVFIQPPGVAEVSLSETPLASSGQAVVVSMTVSNTGGMPLTGVQAALSAAPAFGSVVFGPVPAGPQSIPAGGKSVFTWSYLVSGAGESRFSATATGFTCNSAVAASATASVASVLPASLHAGIAVGDGAIVVGEWITVTMTVTNSGGAPATGVVPVLNHTGAAIVLVSGPSPVSSTTIAGGASFTFSWTYSVSGAGSLAFTGNASGHDGYGGFTENSGAISAVSATTYLPAVFISGSPFLTPSSVVAGGQFSGSINVRNAGGAPLEVTGITVTKSPSSLGGLLASSGLAPALPVAIPGGSSKTFTWVHSSALPCGTVSVDAVVSAREPGTGEIFTPASRRSNVVGIAGVPATLSLSAVPATEHVNGGVTLVALLADTCGIGVPGYLVDFAVDGGGGRVQPASATTDVSGRARVTMFLGPEPGLNSASASLSSPALSATLAVVAMPDALALETPGTTGLSLNSFSPSKGEVVLARVYPSKPGEVVGQIFTASGLLVRTLKRNTPIGGGQWVMDWDGKTDEGYAVARGVYLVHIKGGGIKEILKVVVK